jgi:hypothetical protein
VAAVRLALGRRRNCLGRRCRRRFPFSGLVSGFQQRGQRRADGHGLAHRHQQFAHHAVVPALDLHGGLGGLDDGHDLAAFHGVAGGDQPLVELALVHVGAE